MTEDCTSEATSQQYLSPIARVSKLEELSLHRNSAKVARARARVSRAPGVTSPPLFSLLSLLQTRLQGYMC